MTKEKLLGVEFCRGLAIYAVILFHSGDETWGLPIAPNAITFRLFFYFAVPFFLATAFYFMAAKLEVVNSAKFWRLRIERLVMPYVIWSAIFLVSKIVVFTLGHQPDRLQQLLQDPLSIVFLGGASYHLYFLPLLFTGTMLLLIPLLSKLETSKYSLLFFSVLCILLYDLLEVSENNFQLGKNIAFENLLSSWGLAPEQYPLLRLVAVAVAWLVRCLPYLFVALTLRQFLRGAESLYSGFACVGCAFAFILTSTVGGLFLPGALQELALAYTLLLFSLSLSHYLTAGSIASFAASAGACSFGIYLIHPFVMNVVKPLVGKILPGVTVSISIASMLLLSIPCFLISWLVVALLRRNKLMAKYLFGT